VVTWAGCFDFDLLERPLDDLSASLDLATDANADGGGCLLPSLPGNVLYVAPGGAGDGSSPSAPFGSIQSAIQAAGQTSTAILIASGTYTEALTITGGDVALYGGYDPSFACRDSSQPPLSTITPPVAKPAIAVTGGTFVLDGLTVIGGATGATTAYGLAVDGTGAAVSGTVRRSEIVSHQPASLQVYQAYAVSVKAGTISIDHSHLVTGATVAAIAPSSIALYLCTAAATITDSTLETGDPTAGHAQRALMYDSIACGTPALTPSLTVKRSKLLAEATGGANMAVWLGASNVRPRFESSALVAVGGNALVINNAASSPMAVDFVGSTLNSVNSTAINVFKTSQLTLGLTDTIVTGNVPIAVSGPAAMLAVTPMGVNLLHGSTATVLATSSGNYTIAMYNATYDLNAQDHDPMFISDNFHLSATSPAKDLTGSATCSTPLDIDGETRPRGTFCDVGADEL
jgi:hypothetical protein